MIKFYAKMIMAITQVKLDEYFSVNVQAFLLANLRND